MQTPLTTAETGASPAVRHHSFVRDLRQKNEAPVVAVVGSGIAGMVATLDLLEKGYRVVEHDAGSRQGGRVQSRSMGNYTINAGAEIVDADDYIMVDLCKRLGVELIDRSTLQPDASDACRVDGKRYTDDEIYDIKTGQGAYAALRAQIAADKAAMKDADGNWTEYGRTLDKMSADEYLRKNAHLAPEWVQKILRAAFTIEIGRDMHEQSALNLVDFACTRPLTEEEGFRLYESDETYVVKGGTEKIVEALQARIAEVVVQRAANGERDVYVRRTSSTLKEAHPDTDNGQKCLTFHNAENGMDETAMVDGVVCAIPAYALAQVAGQEHLGLDAKGRDVVANAQYNQWLKVTFPTKGRPWETDGQGNPTLDAGGSFTSNIYQSCWATPQPDGNGTVTMLIGGSIGVNGNLKELLETAKQQYAAEYGKTPDQVFDNAIAPCISNWGKQNGCSLAPKPGSYVDLSEFSRAERKDPRVGFAGSWVMKEHKFGFMENTAASALAATQHIAQALPLVQKTHAQEGQAQAADAPVIQHPATAALEAQKQALGLFTSQVRNIQHSSGQSLG